MGTYRKEWPCCNSVTETDAWEPDNCPFCMPAAAPPAAQLDAGLPPVPNLLESLEMAALWIENITPEQLELWRETKVADIRRDIRHVQRAIEAVVLPALPIGNPAIQLVEEFGAGTYAYTAEQVRQAQREAIAPYAERIRLLERGLEDWKKSSGLLAASRDRWKDSAKRCEQPAQSIRSNEFRNLIEAHDRAADFGEMDAAYEAIVAYIDGRTAGTAPEGKLSMSMFATRADFNEALSATTHSAASGTALVDPEMLSKRHVCGLGGDYWGVCPACLAAAPSTQEGAND